MATLLDPIRTGIGTVLGSASRKVPHGLDKWVYDDTSFAYALGLSLYTCNSG